VTAEEFEARYAKRSGVTVAWLHAHGRYAQRCHCGWGMCEGWEMGHQQEDAIAEDALRAPPPSPGARLGALGRAVDAGELPGDLRRSYLAPP
jgi:hypothetical protein